LVAAWARNTAPALRSSLLPNALRTTCAFAGMMMIRFSPCGTMTNGFAAPTGTVGATHAGGRL
jgi:hypothetical protein